MGWGWMDELLIVFVVSWVDRWLDDELFGWILIVGGWVDRWMDG